MLQGVNRMSDAELLERHFMGQNNECLAGLYERYLPLVYGVCLKYLGNVDDASEAVVDIFSALAAKSDLLDIADFRAWLHKFTKEHCVKVLRKKGWDMPADKSVKNTELSDITHILSDEELSGERLAAIRESVEALPAQQRVCVESFFFDRKSYADIVAETRYQLKSVRGYIQSGKRNIKSNLDKIGK